MDEKREHLLKALRPSGQNLYLVLTYGYVNPQHTFLMGFSTKTGIDVANLGFMVSEKFV